ncbi:MAG TPA: DUF2460 domain-containing protein, partial [Sphingomicrobium sp.]|nr:DUF2460 domain-containing protein [Sphingomicrobium sp.]
HRDFARAARSRGYEIIWSISYEILDMFCPEGWKQRTFDGAAALTAYDPPSALVSPANAAAIAFLADVAQHFAGIAQEAGLQPRVQIGEPWWWVTETGAIALYDDAARTAFGGSPVEIADVRGPLDGDQLALLDAAGTVLADSTATIADAVKQSDPNAKSLVLVYLPSVLDPDAPELRRANLPMGWARPAFDLLQLEDYEWVTSGRSGLRAAAYAQVDARLGYPRSEQHYLAGFVADDTQRGQWAGIINAAVEARKRGCAEVLIWALPQVLRDGLTIFGEEQSVTPFDDVLFPLDIGMAATVSPTFSTNIVTSASGHEFRNANWSQGRLRFDAGPGVRGDTEMEALLAFFRARRGPAIAFRFRDPYDHSSNGMTSSPGAMDQPIGTGDGILDRFELTKIYGTGEQRRITRPVPGSVRVALDGAEISSGWTLEPLGIIRFAEAPEAGAAVTAGFEFDVPVRFSEDQIEVNKATFLAGEAPSVPLIEIREG